MINGLEGIPGSGKSYEAVVYHVLHALSKGRKVITNLPLLVDKISSINSDYADLIELRHRASPVLGTWDAMRVDDKGNGSAFELFPLGSAFPVPSETDNGIFGGVWDFYTTWKHPITGQGPLFLIDECHIAMPVTGTNPQVVEWFKLHRHFNSDVLLATQNFRDMNQPIARLIAMLVKVRSADILGKPDSYIRKVHAGYRGAVISTEERKYKLEYFGLYKSHSQGNSVAESSAADVKPFIVKFKRFTRVFIGVTLCYCCWAGYRFFNQPAKAAPVSPVLSSFTPSSVKSLAVPAAASVSAVAPALAVDPQKMVEMPAAEVPEPYASKGLHLAGRFTMGARTLYTFIVSSGPTRIGHVNSDELKLIGYVWQPITDCAGTLRWKGRAKTVTCDAPAASEGSSGAPVVLALPAGSVTPSARSDHLM